MSGGLVVQGEAFRGRDAVEQILFTMFVTPLRLILNIARMYINSLLLVIESLEHQKTDRKLRILRRALNESLHYKIAT